MRIIVPPRSHDAALVSRAWPAIVFPWLLMCCAWLILVVLTATQHMLDHDSLLRGGQFPWMIALLLFLAMWQVMMLAMMLPSCFSPLAALATPGERWMRLWRRQGAFLLGYAAVWLGFALFAFVGDTGVHWLVNHWRWLDDHSWLIATTTLVVAGLFQFLPSKRRSLHRCTAYAVCMKDGQMRPVGQGIRYGWLCLGSCWAMMLVMVAFGMKSLLLTELFTGIVLVEKGLPLGQRLWPYLGIGFLALAVLVGLFPAFLA